MLLRGAAVAGAGLFLCACNGLTVREATLSNNQTVAMVSTPGDGVSPPTNVVLIKDRHGNFVPVSTGYAQAPVTALFAGAMAGVAVGGGLAGAAALRKPDNVNAFSSGSTSFSTSSGGTAIGGSATALGGTAFGGNATSF